MAETKPDNIDSSPNKKTTAESPSTSSVGQDFLDDETLTKRAIAEILASMSSGVDFGAPAAPKTPTGATNKRFLTNTITATIQHNQRKTTKIKEMSQKKLKELDILQKCRKSKRKFGERRHEYSRPEKPAAKEDL